MNKTLILVLIVIVAFVIVLLGTRLRNTPVSQLPEKPAVTKTTPVPFYPSNGKE